MNYYDNYVNMYRAATEENRRKSFEHWMNCHEMNVKNAAPEMIIFSGEILKRIIGEQIATATADIKKNGYTWEEK